MLLEFPAKPLLETRLLEFPFISQLAPAETITTQSVAASVWSGIDASPSSLLSGAASSSGTTVSQKVTGGTAGVIYRLTCTITTSLGQTLTLSGLLAVLGDPV